MLVATVMALTAVIFGAEVFVERRIAVDSHIDPAAGIKKKKKARLSDAVAVLKSSPMIFALSLMVISYGVGHRLFEFAWKGQLRMLYPSAMAYQVHPSLSCGELCFPCIADSSLSLADGDAASTEGSKAVPWLALAGINSLQNRTCLITEMSLLLSVPTAGTDSVTGQK